METVDFTEKLAETDAAVFLDFGDDGKHWLPKSQIELNEKTFVVEMPSWLYKEKFG